MYTEYFNFKIKPFELVPNPEFLYQSHSHKKALDYLQFGLHELAGFILLTGEVGSGKTTIVRNIIKEMEENVTFSMVFNTKVSNKQILAMINDDFGLSVTGKDKTTLLRNLNDYLINNHADDRRAVIIIDEAQNLTVSALEEIRLLSNLEATTSKLLQIVLVGQPELNKTILRHELRQLRQRISVHVKIEPLTREETENYVYYRLEVAGNRNALKWGEGTFDLLYEFSKGVPRLINLYCDYLLIAACVEGVKELNLEFVQEVFDGLSWDEPLNDQDPDSTVEQKASLGENLLERLNNYEQKIVALEGLLSHREEINEELKEQKELLNQIVQIQESGFKQMEDSLERTCSFLQMYMTGFISERNPDSKEDNEKNDQIRKGLLSKLFT